MAEITLKEYFDSRIDAVEKHIEDIGVQRDAARKIAVAELERRLNDLNHAHERATVALATYLLRDTWDKYKQDDEIWKRQAEVLRSNSVTQEEFRTYKETTQQALTLTAGRNQGIGSVWGAVIVLFSVLSGIATASMAVLTFLRH